MNIFDNFTKEELENVIHKYHTWREITSELGSYDKHNKMVPLLKKKLEELGIDYTCVDSTPLLRRDSDKCRNQYTRMSDSEIFNKSSTVSLSTVRRALKRHTEIPYECAICHMPPVWQDKPLVLTMDHKDGDTTNNLLSNLRWVCPNCDRQLPTYCGKNKKHEYKRPYVALEDRKSGKNICPICGGVKEADADYCRKCYNIKERKVERPNRNVLKEEIRNMSILKIGEKYGVSDNAIRNWCKSYDLPYRKTEIKKFSEEDWKNV